MGGEFYHQRQHFHPSYIAFGSYGVFTVFSGYRRPVRAILQSGVYSRSLLSGVREVENEPSHAVVGGGEGVRSASKMRAATGCSCSVRGGGLRAVSKVEDLGSENCLLLKTDSSSSVGRGGGGGLRAASNMEDLSSGNSCLAVRFSKEKLMSINESITWQ